MACLLTKSLDSKPNASVTLPYLGALIDANNTLIVSLVSLLRIDNASPECTSITLPKKTDLFPY